MDLIETRNNPENIDFYDWNSVIIDNCYINNLNNNIDNIIEIVKENIIKITNNTKNYYIENDEVVLDLGLINRQYCHHFIDTLGYCYRQVPNVRPPWVLHFTRRRYHFANLKPGA
jgi:hypothetical protein